MNKTCCVYLGASTPKNANTIQATKQIGMLLAKHKVNLVYGGAARGLMGMLADGALKENVHTTGVMSDDLLDIEVIHPELNDLIYTKTINQRKEKMIELSDCFIMMPGGVGTCEEFFNTWCHIKITNSTKHIGLLNIDGFYDPLLTLIEHMERENFIQKSHRSMVHCHHEIQSLIQTLLGRIDTP
jgi:uncharacterized protein (TIGR00730 family)